MPPEDFDSAQGNPPEDKAFKIKGAANLRESDTRTEHENKKLRKSPPQGVICFHCRRMGHIARDCFASPHPYSLSTEPMAEQKGGKPTTQDCLQIEMMDCSLGKTIVKATKEKYTVWPKWQEAQ